jgi:sec-independent protein translocase protein TatB
MLSLSPAKLLVILVIALIVLGPEKLPQMARQIGAAWHDLRLWRSRLENEVRGTFPNLPPTHEVAQAVRSPLAFLDRLADEHERALGDEAIDAEATSGSAGTGASGPASPAGAGPSATGELSTSGTVANGSVAGNGSGSPSGTEAHGTEAHNGSGATVPSPPGAHGASVEDAGTVAPGAFPVAPDDPSMN